MSKYIPRTNKSVQQEIPNQISVYFHRNNLMRIQDALGKNCTMVAHVAYPTHRLVEVKTHENSKPMLRRVKGETQYGVIAKFGNKVKPIRAMLNGTPDDIKGEYYAQLKNDMSNEARKRGIL